MNKVNLGESFEKFKLSQMAFPPNPMTKHIIQDKLAAIKGGDFLSGVIRRAAMEDFDGCLNLVLEGYKDNPQMMKEILGKELLVEIGNYEAERKQYLQPQSENDIPVDLFLRPMADYPFGYVD